MLKAVILMGGPQKGTRFRPLSLDIPKPLFPVAGRPMVQHLIAACCKVPNLREVFLIGFYQQDEQLTQFINKMSKEYKISVRYLQEYTSLGTAGGFYHFRDQIRRGNPEGFFLINGDVCGKFDLASMLTFHQGAPASNLITLMATEATRAQSVNFGCVVEDEQTHEVQHYVEKPSTFVFQTINCGVYLCKLELFSYLAGVYNRIHQNWLHNSGDHSDPLNSDCNDNFSADNGDCIYLEDDVLTKLAGTGQIHVYHTQHWWAQIKTAGSVIYANRKYLELLREEQPQLLAVDSTTGPKIIGDVIISPSAQIDLTATLGPNVSIGKNVRIGSGVRVKESLILHDATINDHSLVMHSIVGWNNTIGAWSRVEGTPCDPNPNSPYAKPEDTMLFNGEGKLNPSITVLGSNVQVPSEVIVLNSIVLPHKELSHSYKNEIIL